MKLIKNKYIECTRLESRVLLLLIEEFSTQKNCSTKYISDLTNSMIANQIFCAKSSVEYVIKSFYDVNICTLVYENKRMQLRTIEFNCKIDKYENRRLYLLINENLNLEKFQNEKQKYQKTKNYNDVF